MQAVCGGHWRGASGERIVPRGRQYQIARLDVLSPFYLLFLSDVSHLAVSAMYGENRTSEVAILHE